MKSLQKRSAGSIEKEFLDALDRLRNGRPTHPELVTAVAQRRLRINVSTVAKEAGRSRTLIASKNCRYPAVRREIKKVCSKANPGQSGTDLVMQLRRENLRLREEVRQAHSLALAYLREKEDALEELKALKRKKG